jgi:hypothetical protein
VSGANQSRRFTETPYNFLQNQRQIRVDFLGDL